jgi:hypothetical protein
MKPPFIHYGHIGQHLFRLTPPPHLSSRFLFVVTIFIPAENTRHSEKPGQNHAWQFEYQYYLWMWTLLGSLVWTWSHIYSIFHWWPSYTCIVCIARATVGQAEEFYGCTKSYPVLSDPHNIRASVPPLTFMHPWSVCQIQIDGHVFLSWLTNVWSPPQTTKSLHRVGQRIGSLFSLSMSTQSVEYDGCHKYEKPDFLAECI